MQLTPFAFDSCAIRAIDIDGQPWFVGKDVALALGYSNANQAMNQHCRGVVKHHPIVDTLSRDQQTRILSEPDVFRLIVASHRPEEQ